MQDRLLMCLPYKLQTIKNPYRDLKAVSGFTTNDFGPYNIAIGNSLKYGNR